MKKTILMISITVLVIITLKFFPIIYIWVSWKLEKPKDIKKETEILEKGIKNKYSKQKLDEFCSNKYVLNMEYNKNNKIETKIIVLKKEKNNWIGNYIQNTKNKNINIPVLYKNEKFYNIETNKIVDELKDFSFYFQKISLDYNKLINKKIEKTENTSIFGYKNEYDIFLKAEYTVEDKFYNYFKKNFNKNIKNNDEKIIFQGKYLERKEENVVNIIMETENLKINEKCGYDVQNRELQWMGN